jgi:hypothetical protein
LRHGHGGGEEAGGFPLDKSEKSWLLL